MGEFMDERTKIKYTMNLKVFDKDGKLKEERDLHLKPKEDERNDSN